MNTRKRPRIRVGRILARFLLFVLICGGIYWVANEAWSYWRTYTFLPRGAVIAGVDVSGLTREESMERVRQVYEKPVLAVYNQEVIEIDVIDLGFELNLVEMADEAVAIRDSASHTDRFLAHLARRPVLDQQPIDIELNATHDPQKVNIVVALLGDIVNRPAQSPQLLNNAGGKIQEGRDGYVIDSLASSDALIEALYRPYDRTAKLTVVAQEAPEINMAFLENYIQQLLNGFDGIGSIYILDLQTGEEIKINADAAISGLSVVKIAIMLESYRAVEAIGFDHQKLLEETAIHSGNYSANLLLDIVAGQDNAYLGVDVLTESMWNLGLVNTFIATPYEEQPRAGKRTVQTPANNDLTLVHLDPDPAMQTTAAEIGQLLAMIYECSQGGGTLIAVYPSQLTPTECQNLIDLMALNHEGNLIRFGVPEEVTVAHKHGWAYNTHGDAGIIYSPNGNYVIAQYLYQDSDWLASNISFPLLREISRSVYNYFNSDTPYIDHKRAQREAGVFALNRTIQAAETSFGTGQ